MSITQDASTPAAVDNTGSTSATAVTASFSPPAGSTVVIVVNIGFQGIPSSPSVTVRDSSSNSYTAGPAAWDSEYAYSGIFSAYYGSAPGSITVTATRTPTAAALFELVPYVLDGTAASQSGAASGANSGGGTATSATSSVTTTKTGSWLITAVTIGNPAETLTAVSIGTQDNSKSDSTDICTTATGHTVISSAGAVTTGWTYTTNADFSWAALEILPAPAAVTPAVLNVSTAFPAPAAGGGVTASPGTLAMTAAQPAPSLVVLAGGAGGTAGGAGGTGTGGTGGAGGGISSAGSPGTAPGGGGGGGGGTGSSWAGGAGAGGQIVIIITTTALATPSAQNAAAAFPAVTASGGTGTTTTPAALAASPAYPAPAVSAGSAATASPAALAVPVSFLLPSVQADTPSLAVTAGFPAATASGGTGASVTVFGGTPVTASFPAPAVRQDQDVTPAALAAAAAIPVVSTGSSVNIQGVIFTAPNAAFPLPVVRQDATASPATLTVSPAFPAPTAAAGTVAAPALLAVGSAFPASTASAGSGTVVSGPAGATASAAYPAPVVRQDATASPAALAAATSRPAPVIVTGTVIMAAAATPAAVFPAPVVRQDTAASPAALTLPVLVFAVSTTTFVPKAISVTASATKASLTAAGTSSTLIAGPTTVVPHIAQPAGTNGSVTVNPTTGEGGP